MKDNNNLTRTRQKCIVINFLGLPNKITEEPHPYANISKDVHELTTLTIDSAVNIITF